MKAEVVTVPGFDRGFDDRVWSPGLRLGPWLFLSGIVSYDYVNKRKVGVSEGTSMTPGTVDVEAQWRQTLTNIQGSWRPLAAQWAIWSWLTCS